MSGAAAPVLERACQKKLFGREFLAQLLLLFKVR
jgi:hypothetical protein